MCFTENQQSLQKKMDQLSHMETTRKELLDQARQEVDEPVKVKPKKAKQGATRKEAKIAAAKQRAKQLIQHLSPTTTNSETDSSASVVAKLQKELAELKKKVESESG